MFFVCVSVIFHDSGFLIHKYILWIEDVEDRILFKKYVCICVQSNGRVLEKLK